MMHDTRRWRVVPADSPEQLARDLTKKTWCCCNGFALEGYWFLNDATSADDAQEYAVVKIEGPDGKRIQVESITMSWCSFDQALHYIRQTLAGEYDDSDFAAPVDPVVETPDRHGRCPLCA